MNHTPSLIHIWIRWYLYNKVNFRLLNWCWNELRILGLLKWSEYILHESRTWPWRDQEQKALFWMSMFPKNSYVEIIAPKVIVLDEVFGRRVVDHEGRDFINGIRALIKETKKPSHLHVRTQWEDGHLWTRKQALSRHWILGTFILNFPALRTVKNKCCLLIFNVKF